MSFDQLSKRKKAGTTATSAPPKAAASPRNIPEKPPSQAPQTNLHDLKKFVQSDKKSEMAKGGSKTEKPVEPKPAFSQGKNALELKGKEKEKEKPATHEDAHLAQQKLGRKGKNIEEQ